MNQTHYVIYKLISLPKSSWNARAQSPVTFEPKSLINCPAWCTGRQSTNKWVIGYAIINVALCWTLCLLLVTNLRNTALIYKIWQNVLLFLIMTMVLDVTYGHTRARAEWQGHRETCMSWSFIYVWRLLSGTHSTLQRCEILPRLCTGCFNDASS